MKRLDRMEFLLAETERLITAGQRDGALARLAQIENSLQLHDIQLPPDLALKLEKFKNLTKPSRAPSQHDGEGS
jgi:hypothetical protein